MGTIADSMNTPISPATCPHCGAAVETIRYTFGSITHELPGQCNCPAACAEEEARECEETAKAARELHDLLQRRYKRANIPRKFWYAPIRDKSALQSIEQGQGIYLQGLNGRGKTELASAIGCCMIQRGMQVRFISAVELKGALFSTSYKTETEQQLFERLATPRLLILDDIGKEPDSKPVISMLYRIVDERDKSQRPIIVTSNYSKQELANRLAKAGDESTARAIASRLFGMTRKIEMTGRDWRIPEKEG